jgi:capsular polysaccharide biosynthesis protein
MYIQKYILIALISTSTTQSTTQIITEVSATEFAQLNPQAQVLQCTKDYPFNFKPYPLYPEYAQEKFPHQGLFQDMYILSVPNGTAHFCNYPLWAINGLIFINDYFIKECQIKNISPFYLNKIKTIEVQQSVHNYTIPGSIAICSHIYPDCYGHFMLDVLCQLALLEIFNIEYDYLCIPYHTKFMQEALNLWGIDQEKIIPLQFNLSVKADTIILPTSTTQIHDITVNANYTADFLIEYVSKKLLDGVMKKNIHLQTSSKVFISRKDAHNKRFVPNEDDIFKLFENYGFERYELTKLSLAEQILLFHNAQEIVSFVGSGSLNIIFSQPKTKYIEITQTMLDATFFFLANIADIDYRFIDATNPEDIKHSNPCSRGRSINLEIISNFLKDNLNL